MQKIISITCKVEGNLEKAFDYFLNAKYAPEAIVEPKVGGKYETYWNPPEREVNSTIGCKLIELVKNKLLSFEWKGPPQFHDFMNVNDPLTLVTIFFTDIKLKGENYVEVFLLHTGWGSSTEWNKAREYFDKAWNQIISAFMKYMKD